MNILNAGSKLAVLVIIIIILIIMGYAIFGKREAVTSSPLVGKQAPDFTLKQFDGEEIKLSDLRGKTVLVNFWASWCMPCRQEARALEESWEKYKDKDVVFIGVNVWDEQSSAISYMDKYGGPYPHGTDPAEKIQVEYGIGGVPETYFISPSGVIIDKYNGPLTERIIDYYLQKSMNPGSESS